MTTERKATRPADPIMCVCGHPVSRHPCGQPPNLVYQAERVEARVAAADPDGDLSPRELAAILRARHDNPFRRAELFRRAQMRRQSLKGAQGRSEHRSATNRRR